MACTLRGKYYMLTVLFMKITSSMLANEFGQDVEMEGVPSFTQSTQIQLDHESIAYYRDFLAKHFRNNTIRACDEDMVKVNCPVGTQIHILSAFYGHDSRQLGVCEMIKNDVNRVDPSGDNRVCHFEHTLKVILNLCNAKRTCRFQLSSKLFQLDNSTDMCPSVRKYLTASYRCQIELLRGQLVCADSYRELTCPHDDERHVILIAHARTTNRMSFVPAALIGDIANVYAESGGMQLCSNTRSMPVVPCLENDITSRIQQSCHVQQLCTVMAGQPHQEKGNRNKFNMSQQVICARQHTFLLYACVPQKELAIFIKNEKKDEEAESHRSVITLRAKKVKHASSAKTIQIQRDGLSNDYREIRNSNQSTHLAEISKNNEVLPAAIIKHDASSMDTARSATNITSQNNSMGDTSAKFNLAPKLPSDVTGSDVTYVIVGASIAALLASLGIMLTLLLIHFCRRKRILTRSQRERQATTKATTYDDQISQVQSDQKSSLYLQELNKGPPVTCYPVPSAQILLDDCATFRDAFESNRCSILSKRHQYEQYDVEQRASLLPMNASQNLVVSCCKHANQCNGIPLAYPPEYQSVRFNAPICTCNDSLCLQSVMLPSKSSFSWRRQPTGSSFRKPCINLTTLSDCIPEETADLISPPTSTPQTQHSFHKL